MPDKKLCEKCGKVHVTWHGHQSCSAHIVGSDPLTPCSKPPKAGRTVCRSHGANLPNVAREAEQRLALMSAQGEIADLMRECDIPEQHPIDGLLEAVRVSGAMMRLVTLKVGELKEDPSVTEVLVESRGGDLSTKQVAEGDAFWGLNAQGEMVPHTYVGLLKVWTERYERACKTALDAGVAERQVRLMESQAELLAKAIQGILADLGLTSEQQAQAPSIVRRHLMQLPAGNVG